MDGRRDRSNHQRSRRPPSVWFCFLRDTTRIMFKVRVRSVYHGPASDFSCNPLEDKRWLRTLVARLRWSCPSAELLAKLRNVYRLTIHIALEFADHGIYCVIFGLFSSFASGSAYCIYGISVQQGYPARRYCRIWNRSRGHWFAQSSVKHFIPSAVGLMPFSRCQQGRINSPEKSDNALFAVTLERSMKCCVAKKRRLYSTGQSE